MGPFVYKMIQVPPSIQIKESKGEEAAQYLEAAVNKEAQRGWEFFRVDTIGVAVRPGCLGALMGRGAVDTAYYVMTFRKPAQ